MSKNDISFRFVFVLELETIWMEAHFGGESRCQKYNKPHQLINHTLLTQTHPLP